MGERSGRREGANSELQIRKDPLRKLLVRPPVPSCSSELETVQRKPWNLRLQRKHERGEESATKLETDRGRDASNQLTLITLISNLTTISLIPPPFPAPLLPPNIHPFAPSSSPPLTPPTGVLGRGAIACLTGLGETGGDRGSTIVLATAVEADPDSVGNPFVEAPGVLVFEGPAPAESSRLVAAVGTVTKDESPEVSLPIGGGGGGAMGVGRRGGSWEGGEVGAATSPLSFDEEVTIPSRPFELFLLRLGFRRIDPVASIGDVESLEGAATVERSMDGV